ncbi:MAG: hypothetical protein ACREWE_00195 [Gammaproteobacteria bacterium]
MGRKTPDILLALARFLIQEREDARMGDFRFTPDQRKRLVQFQVSPKQIEKLEGACLVGRAWLRKSPPCTVVSEKIKALSGHLRAAREILEEIRAAKTPECRVAEAFLSRLPLRQGGGIP